MAKHFYAADAPGCDGGKAGGISIVVGWTGVRDVAGNHGRAVDEGIKGRDEPSVAEAERSDAIARPTSTF